ncbi:alpha/beta hydrolase [Maribacter sp.]|nr:alpha/beta hydrolase [Maribacter sp.]
MKNFLSKSKRYSIKTLKWLGISIGLLLLLIILAGLCLRLFSAEPKPPGELVEIGEFKLHINSTGEKNEKPTLVIEGGGGMASEYYHWLSEGLKDSMRVVRYDRAGIGYSDASNTKRDPETIAHELHTLLEKAGELPPYIVVGHSLGGPYIRVFTELYPNEVVGMFLLDTTHPDRVARIPSIPKKSSLKSKSMIWMYDFQSILGDFGIMLIYDKLTGPILHRKMEGLPDEINNRTKDFLNDGKYIRAMGKEMEQYHTTLERAGKTDDFGSLPLRVFTDAIGKIPEEVYKEYLERGIDLRKTQIESMKMQEELINLSTNSKLTLIDGNHITIFTIKENADIICKEVLQLYRELGY